MAGSDYPKERIARRFDHLDPGRHLGGRVGCPGVAAEVIIVKVDVGHLPDVGLASA
ncbi:MAG: hypothetical protein IIC72_04375 [Acidobacteria bacterium]|nr:hypothetical protein [Acidobacteriota bacterium]